ncbi:proteasome core particle subunit beta 2 [Mitosporidium daphniae]
MHQEAATDSDHQLGFCFDNYQRNLALCSSSKAVSTGTTIVGVVYKNGIVLGADTRSTFGPIVANKNCEKIHYLAPHIYCCGAGTAADTEAVTAMVRSSLELASLNSGRPARLSSAMMMLKQRLFNYQGHIGAALIVGGVDIAGCHLYTVYPHGSTDNLPFVTMGSGSLAAMSVFEGKYRPKMEQAEAMELVSEAIQAGIFNDLGSGSNVDLVVIERTEGGPAFSSTKVLRGYKKPNPKPTRIGTYLFQKGTTVVLKEEFVPYSEKTSAALRSA